MGIVVHHASGARIEVDELLLAEAAPPFAEGGPTVDYVEQRARRVVEDAFGSRPLTRVRPIDWDAALLVENAALLAENAALLPEKMRGGPSRPAIGAPRFACAADCHVARASPEGEGTRASLVWWESGALAKTCEELLQTCATIDLDDDPAPHAPDERGPGAELRSGDGVAVSLGDLRVRFRVVGSVDKALAAWTPKGHYTLPRDFTSKEQPLLVRARFHGPAVPLPDEDAAASFLLLAFVAEARGDVTLVQMLNDALARVDWSRRATPWI